MYYIIYIVGILARKNRLVMIIVRSIFLVLKEIFKGVGDFLILSGESPYRGTGQNKLRRWGFNFKKLNCI